RLIDDDGGESPDAHDQRRRAAQVYECDGEAAPNPEPPDPHLADRPDDRVEQQRDQRGDEEEDDDVKDAARGDPRQDQQDRKPDQLHPARNLDLRRRAGSHRGHRTAEVVRLQPEPWDWALETDGSLARNPSREDWFVSVRPVRLKGLAGSATVPRMPAPPAYRRHDRHAARARQ